MLIVLTVLATALVYDWVVRQLPVTFSNAQAESPGPELVRAKGAMLYRKGRTWRLAVPLLCLGAVMLALYILLSASATVVGWASWKCIAVAEPWGRRAIWRSVAFSAKPQQALQSLLSQPRVTFMPVEELKDLLAAALASTSAASVVALLLVLDRIRSRLWTRLSLVAVWCAALATQV